MVEKNKRKLEGLKAQLDGYADDDAKAREFSDSLSRLVKRDRPDEDDERSKWQELREEIEQYEAEHPELIALLNRIATTLSDMGI